MRIAFLLLPFAAAGCAVVGAGRPACYGAPGVHPGVPVADERDRSVFRALSGPSDVVEDRTTPIRGGPAAQTAMPRDLVVRLFARNRAAAIIGNLRNGSCALTREQKQVLARAPDYWSLFRDVFGGRRVIWFSLPAYSDDGATALVRREWQADVLVGEGELLLLQRAGPRWHIVKRIVLWIS